MNVNKSYNMIFYDAHSKAQSQKYSKATLFQKM